jgi:hypothetical protein
MEKAMSLANKVFYVSAPAAETYQMWKSLFQIKTKDRVAGEDPSLLAEIPDCEVRWISHWGPAHFDARADFIPAAGGCVVYVSLTGVGMLSRIGLSAASRFSCGPWRLLTELPGTHVG